MEDKATGAACPAAARIGFEVCRAARRHGTLLRLLGEVGVLLPPLSLAAAEARLLTDALEDAARRVCG